MRLSPSGPGEQLHVTDWSLGLSRRLPAGGEQLILLVVREVNNSDDVFPARGHSAFACALCQT